MVGSDTTTTTNLGRRRAPARKMNLLHGLAFSPLHLLARAPPALFSPSKAFVVPPSRRRHFGWRWSVSASVSSSSAAAAAEVDAEPIVVASEINGEGAASNGEDEKVVLPTNQTSERLLRIRHTVRHLSFSYRFPVHYYSRFRLIFPAKLSVKMEFFANHSKLSFLFAMNLNCFDLKFTYAMTFHLAI